METPYIGASVHYLEEGQTCHAAIITSVGDSYNSLGDIQLAVFPPEGGILRKSDIEYRDQDTCPSGFWSGRYPSWHWPDIPKETS